MRAALFVGPSLGGEVPAAQEGLAVLPPAGRGDVYRAVRAGAQVVGLVDGYFDGVPAVAHKEILWALARGVRVLGAASMGALRAAELAVYGMEGVGGIAAAYAAGAIEGDDEVAVLHGPAESGWLVLSEALVNVRATLAAAEAAGVLDRPAAASVERAARALFYKERRWPLILARAADPMVGSAALARLADWLPSGRVDHKRADALLLVAALDRPGAIAAPGFAFERTELWDDLVAEAEGDEAAGADDGLARLLLGELRLEPDLHRVVRDRALARLLVTRRATSTAAGPPAEPDIAAVKAVIERHRAEAGLLRRTELAAWLAARGVDEAWLAGQARDVARLDALAAAGRPALDALCLDELRLRADFPARLARARRQRELLAGPSGELGPGAAVLPAWTEGFGLSPAEAAVRLGFQDVAALYRALRAQRLYEEREHPDCGAEDGECATGGR